MLAKRTRDSESAEHSPHVKQRKVLQFHPPNTIIDDIDQVVVSEHVLKYLENLELIRFSMVSTKCREIFRNYQARIREFLFVLERFTGEETRVIMRECKTVICVNCGFDFSNILNYESNTVNMLIYGEIDRNKSDLITFLTRCKFNNLKKLVLQGLTLHFDDLAHILTSEFIELLQKNLRWLDIMNNQIGSVSYLFNSFHPDLKIFKGRVNSWDKEELERDKYYNCLIKIQASPSYDIGCFFYQNKDFRDYKKAFKYLTQACSHEPKAYEFIGYMYDKGRFVTKDYKAAFANYLKGALQGNSNCAYNVAMSYENGHGVELDLQKAYKYYAQAANNRHVEAIKRMARAYKEGVPNVIPQDFHLAISYYKKLLSHDQEESYFQIGIIYEVGLQDFHAAQQCFEKHLPKLNFLYRYTLVSKRSGDETGYQRGMGMFKKVYQKHNSNMVKKEAEPSRIHLTDIMLDILYYVATLDANFELVKVLFDNISEKTTDILVKLGDYYRTDPEYKNGTQAEIFYKEGLGRGDKGAIFGLGALYLSGVKGQFINLEAAHKFASLIMQSDDQVNIFKIGVEYFYEKYYTEALDCFTKTKDTFQEAQYYISFIEAYYHEKGRNGYNKDVYRCIDLYKQSCTPNFLIPFAFYKTGKLAWNQKYDDMAFTMLKALVAQCQSNPNSAIYTYIHACLYQGGYYVHTDQTKALKLFEMSSNMGYKRAEKAYNRSASNPQGGSSSGVTKTSPSGLVDDDGTVIQPSLGGENIFDDVHSHQYKRDQEYNYNYNQNRIRLNIMAQEDSPYNFILGEIAALVYFDFVFHSSLVQERNYFNMLAWDTKFASFGDRFKKNEKIYFKFLFPKEENMILRVSHLSSSKKIGKKLDSEEYNRWDSRLSLSQQESFLKHFIQMTFGSKGFSLGYSEDYKLGHLDEENVHFKHLQKSYLQSTSNNHQYTMFLKSLRIADKVQQEKNHDKQREESIFINHKPKDKFSDYPTIHITDILNLEYGTTMEVDSIELIQQHFENLLETSNKKQKRLKYTMKNRALNYVLFYMNQQDLLPVLNQTKFVIDEETSNLTGKDLASIYLLLASSPDWIHSWFSYKVRSADTNALRHSSKKKVLLNKLMASIKQQGHNKHSHIHYLIRFWIQGHCDTYCRLNVIKTYHFFKELQSNFPNIFNFSVLFNVDESQSMASLFISVEKEEQVAPIINHLNCKKSCVKEIIQHHEKTLSKWKRIQKTSPSMIK